MMASLGTTLHYSEGEGACMRPHPPVRVRLVLRPAKRDRYLLAQNCVLPSMLACLGATLAAPLYAWPLVFHSGLGVYGAAVAFDLIAATNAALLLGYVVARERQLAGTPQQTWHGWCARLHLTLALWKWRCLA